MLGGPEASRCRVRITVQIECESRLGHLSFLCTGVAGVASKRLAHVGHSGGRAGDPREVECEPTRSGLWLRRNAHTVSMPTWWLRCSIAAGCGLSGSLAVGASVE